MAPRDHSEDGPKAAYRALLAAGELRPDPDQERVVAKLQRLHEALKGYPCPTSKRSLGLRNWSVFKRLDWSKPSAEGPKGLYLWGGVGRGKSMLMDLLARHAQIGAKRRLHFHEFMGETHARITAWRKLDAKGRVAAGGRATEDDPIPPVARQFAQDACLLCLDEMQVNDVADAMIIGRLLTELIDRGVLIVTTSNRPPDDLYKNGLNRQLFLPAIELIKTRLEVVALGGPTDYRLDRLQGLRTYLVGFTEATTNELRHNFFRMTDRSIDDADKVPTEEIEVQGRRIFVPKAARGVAVFSFKRLCANPLGAADYLAIARRYHTVFIVGIPVMGPDKRNEAKRFVTLIDALYDNGVKLLCNAEAEPQDLYKTGDGAFEFERTSSRLMEMQSEEYLKRGHGSV
ncbi:MAG: cell division protein ZapE [Rhodothalassiaceae bacterium]